MFNIAVASRGGSQTPALLPGESMDAADETSWTHWSAVYAELVAGLGQVLDSCRGLPGVDSTRLGDVIAGYEVRLAFWDGVREKNRHNADGDADVTGRPHDRRMPLAEESREYARRGIPFRLSVPITRAAITLIPANPITMAELSWLMEIQASPTNGIAPADSSGQLIPVEQPN